jgi:hypothetical protein
MKKIILCSIAIVLFLSCAGLTRKDTNAWLTRVVVEKEAPEVNLNGLWDSGGGVMTGGWGDGNFVQEGKKVYGSLGFYYVDGIVNGKKVYFALSSGNKVYYTARLTSSDNGKKLTGRACEGAFIDDPDAENARSYPIVLKKRDLVK